MAKTNKNLSFGEVIEEIRDGTKRATRKGWNGKNMFIYIEVGKHIPQERLREPQSKWFDDGLHVLSHFNMKTADGKLVVGWLASQTDMLSKDWIILD